MQMYARHVATSFAAECVNEALGNKMEVCTILLNGSVNANDDPCVCGFNAKGFEFTQNTESI